MASISSDPNGHRRILFMDGNGNRKAIRLGKVTQRQADAFKVKLEALIGQGITGAIDDETSRWLAGLGDKMHNRLAAVGLVKRRERSAATLGKFLADYFAGLAVKTGTEVAYGHTRRCLTEYFGEAKPLREIDPADADKWRQWLRDSKLADATVSRRVGLARMMFGRALRWKLIGENPFEGIKAGAQTNKARMHFIPRDVADKVAAACPDAEWRLLFALSRYGGLRCPSEHFALKWGDVDWEHNRLRVPSPKTEHHEGKDSRIIPLFPELRGPLREVFENAEPGTEWIITRYRDPSQNLRTQLQRIIRRAGLVAWPKLWHNLRSTRQTELAEKYPLHVVCAWIGNSRAVAQDHYLQLTDEHFASAIEPSEKAAQIPAQQASEMARKAEKSDNPESEKRPEFPSVSEPCEIVQRELVGAVGFEPTKA